MIESLTVRSAADGTASSQFFIGEELYVEFYDRRRDLGDRGGGRIRPRRYLPVAARNNTRFGRSLSHGGGSRSGGYLHRDHHRRGDRGRRGSRRKPLHLDEDFDVAPEADPTAPTVDWLTPWEGGSWPAGYSSALATGGGVPMLLRVRAADLNEDSNGEPVAGNIVSVAFRGPVLTDRGSVPSEAAAEGSPCPAPSGEAEYQAVWAIPDQIPLGQEIPFQVRVVDSGGLDVVRNCES